MNDTPSEFGCPPDFERLLPEFRRLCEIIARLRGPDGCPWDRRQTLQSIRPYTLEETCELLEAIAADDNAAIQEELGDLLLQVVLDAQIAADEKRFDLTDVVRQIADKMIRRHPHVFGTKTAQTADEIREHWRTAKAAEKSERRSELDGIPAALPQLARAARITARAAAVGYDFPDRRMLFDKLQEELSELAAELFDDGRMPDVPAGVDSDPIPDAPILDAQQRNRVQSELGDVLFVLANIARRWGISPEEALRESNTKFIRRFQAIEETLHRSGRSLEEASLPEMEAAYQAAKEQEHRTSGRAQTGSGSGPGFRTES